jgi:GT2 family glycosyltransferase
MHRIPARPQVTVIIPTFNRARYLAEAVQSVLDQTFSDYELIVVDDGSTDGTSAVLAGFEDPRLRVLSQENRGISAAMNAGLRAARGEYIARLDSDDVWFSDLLTRETSILDSHPDIGVVYSKAQAMSANGRSREHYLGLPLRYPYDTLLSLLWGDCTCNITTLARRSCFAAAGPYDETFRTHEDWDMWLRVARSCHFTFLNSTLGRFREHDNRITSPSSPTFVEHIESRVKVLDKFYASPYLPPHISAFKAIAYRNVYTEIGLFLLNTGHPARALPMFGRALVSGGNPVAAFARICWLTMAVQLLKRYGFGKQLLQFQAAVRRRVRLRAWADTTANRHSILPSAERARGDPDDSSKNFGR